MSPTTRAGEIRQDLNGHSLNGTLPDGVDEFRAAVMSLARRLRMQRPDRSIGPAQTSILSRLLSYGPLAATALAEIETLPAPSVARLVASLERRQLVTRERDLLDRRKLIITITEIGKQVILEDRKMRNNSLALGFEALTEKERKQLLACTDLLERVRQAAIEIR
jgi:DNA-binding MarR family transcriptional regulator